jgi:8-oxo-dGTP pyrophosphatase MutT (NUDIX family)
MGSRQSIDPPSLWRHQRFGTRVVAATCCEREILEELGCPLTVIRPVLVDYTRTVGEMVVDHFEWLFEGPSLSREQIEKIRVDGKEIEEYRYVSMAEMPVMVEAFNERRIRNAISAIEHGSLVYTDDDAVKPYPA